MCIHQGSACTVQYSIYFPKGVRIPRTRIAQFVGFTRALFNSYLSSSPRKGGLMIGCKTRTCNACSLSTAKDGSPRAHRSVEHSLWGLCWCSDRHAPVGTWRTGCTLLHIGRDIAAYLLYQSDGDNLSGSAQAGTSASRSAGFQQKLWRLLRWHWRGRPVRMFHFAACHCCRGGQCCRAVGLGLQRPRCLRLHWRQ